MTDVKREGRREVKKKKKKEVYILGIMLQFSLGGFRVRLCIQLIQELAECLDGLGTLEFQSRWEGYGSAEMFEAIAGNRR
jgi:hypothetical protein